MKKLLSPVGLLAATLTVHAGEPAAFPPLPQAVTSFGAAVHQGWVYTYGGHAGEAHKYSLDTMLFDFHRINLAAPTGWNPLPGPARAQGASLVPWNDRLIRVGGLSARNETIDQDEQLISLTDVAAFDPASQRWETLPALPEPRSSHDAVVLDEKLYVVGGWKLSGSRRGEWPGQAWVLDLRRLDRGWKKFPQPFKRRAVAAVAVGQSLIVLGGMDSDGDTAREVDVYDVAEKQWSAGPKLPAGPMNGFGAAACVVGDTAYASTYLGKVFAWRPGLTEWKEVAELRTKRFFHRLVPVSEAQLLAIGGASRQDGHLADVELVNLPEQRRASTVTRE